MSDKEEKIVALLDANKIFSRTEIQNGLGIGSIAVCTLPKKIIKRGLIQKVGAGKNVRYAFPE